MGWQCTFIFLIWTILEAREEILKKTFVGFLVDLKTPKFPFDIKLPLVVVHLKTSWLVCGRNQAYCASCSTQTAHKPVLTSSMKQVVRAYCTNIYTVPFATNSHCLHWKHNLAISFLLHTDRKSYCPCNKKNVIQWLHDYKKRHLGV